MVPDFAGGKPSPLWNAAKKPCPELQSGPCCVPRRCLFPARKGSCRKTGGLTQLLQSFGGQKWENHVSIENDVSNGKYWMEMIYPMEHDVSIGSPFLKLDGNGLHSAHVSNKKTPNSTGPLMRIDPRPEQPHFFMFSISTHFHPEDAIAWEWSGWKQHPDDDNDGHSPL